MGKTKRILGAAGMMLLGTGGVAALLLSLNAGELTAPPPTEKAPIEMAAAPPVQPPPTKRQPRPKRTPPKQSRNAPSPNLGASLGGLDMGLAAPGMQDMAAGLLGDAGEMVHTADTVDSVPRALSQVSPEYPARARSKNIEGYVELSVRVSADGSVAAAQVLNAEPAGVFDDAALTAIEDWEFDPATYEGVPVDVRVQLKLNFKLS
jgi:protein TonB